MRAALTLALVARIPHGGIRSFQAYEAAVLPLLPSHGGRLERRLRNLDGGVEIHIVSFASAEDFASFRADPKRAAAQYLLAESGASTELHEMHDLE